MKGETLTAAQLDAAHPIGSEGGRTWRAFCPFHGGDKQRSLRVRRDNGHFFCFACGVWGYLEEERQRYATDLGGRRSPPPRALPVRAAPVSQPRADLRLALTGYQDALPSSPGEAYLASRGISLGLAQQNGVGFAARGSWLNRNRDWPAGRLVFPHTNPAGQLVNFYGRAIDGVAIAPSTRRHDHLPGSKGYFGADTLGESDEPLFVCEGPFDALSLLAAGCDRVVAIFGVHGWRWEWVRSVREIVFALDADPTGQASWKQLAREACLRGKRVWVLPPESYGGAKDVNEAWQKGCLWI